MVADSASADALSAAATPVTPMPTRAGVLGMVRMRLGFPGKASAIEASLIPAAIEMTTAFGAISSLISASTSLI